VLALAVPAIAEDDADSKINASWEFARANRLASAGAVTRSIPHYEKVLEAAPEKYPQAHFNLAEVYRFKKECRKAVLLYNAYMSFEKGEQNKSDALNGIAGCTQGEKTGTLTFSSKPEGRTKLVIDGYVFAEGNIDKIELIVGEYAIEAQAIDHVSKTDTVAIEEGGEVQRNWELEKKLFFGSLRIGVETKGATVTIEPKDLDSPKAEEETLTITTPVDEPQELATGKYFVEVTKPGFERWIRNVHINRDEEADVRVSLTESLPEAIRPK
jgi:tetratricopeptide (TPR) repeat protein